MSSLRFHLRALVVMWLVCQTAMLSAFVSPDCCPAQEPASAAAECHGDADGLCPMHAAATRTDNGDVQCPLHAAANAVPDVLCVMRGLCSAPSAALSMLFPVFAMPVPQHALEVASHQAVVHLDPIRLLDTPTTHDTPPPRA